MDKLTKPHELAPVAFDDIPTPDQHAREVRQIFTVCGIFAASALVLAVLGVWIALVRGVPLQTVAFVVPIVMGAGIATFAIGYAMPVGLVSLKRLEMAYRMGYFGLTQNRKAVSAMETIAERIKKETQPLPKGQRPSVEV